MKRIYLFLVAIVLLAQSLPLVAETSVDSLKSKPIRVYTFDIKEEIAPPVWRTTQKAFEEAYAQQADLMLIHMNTYGGMLDAADSIRTKLLHSRIPVYVLIDNNAASAGALISIACDSIYMVTGASIGAATVVNQTGEVVADKYQSYMRAMMRSTAEAKGRDPMIAQAMVDPSIFIAGISDSGKVLTFTTSEAIAHGFCNAKAESIEQVLKMTGHEDYELIRHTLSPMDKLINFLIQPAISGLLIMIIIGGLYFELQTPGIGFPLAASVTAALLYFAPLYLEGMASNWEIIVFVLGVVLLLIEIFAIPGFGVTGVLGLLFIVTGLSFAMVETIGDSPFSVDLMALTKSFMLVIFSILMAMLGSIYLSKKLLTTTTFGHFALDKTQEKTEGFTSADNSYSKMIGKKGLVYSMLRPVGKVSIEGEVYEATAMSGYIDQDTEVVVVDYKTGQLIVKKSQ